MDRNKQNRQALEEIADNIEQLLKRLNEQQRRHVLGLLACLLGYGAESFLAEKFAVNRRTVRKGKRELLDGFESLPTEKLRKPGGGRPKLEKKVPISSKPLKKSSKITPEDYRPVNENGRD